ncbi:MAG: hypothetical protein LV481_09980 [Methylacidiphilales bacterium]|nr:hypothetical protein [Candidatus Methylacidiphilales bacterium]
MAIQAASAAKPIDEAATADDDADSSPAKTSSNSPPVDAPKPAASTPATSSAPAAGASTAPQGQSENIVSILRTPAMCLAIATV